MMVSDEEPSPASNGALTYAPGVVGDDGIVERRTLDIIQFT